MNDEVKKLVNQKCSIDAKLKFQQTLLETLENKDELIVEYRNFLLHTVEYKEFLESVRRWKNQNHDSKFARLVDRDEQMDSLIEMLKQKFNEKLFDESEQASTSNEAVRQDSQPNHNSKNSNYAHNQVKNYNHQQAKNTPHNNNQPQNQKRPFQKNQHNFQGNNSHQGNNVNPKQYQLHFDKSSQNNQQNFQANSGQGNSHNYQGPSTSQFQPGNNKGSNQQQGKNYKNFKANNQQGNYPNGYNKGYKNQQNNYYQNNNQRKSFPGQNSHYQQPFDKSKNRSQSFIQLNPQSPATESFNHNDDQNQDRQPQQRTRPFAKQNNYYQNKEQPNTLAFDRLSVSAEENSANQQQPIKKNKQWKNKQKNTQHNSGDSPVNNFDSEIRCDESMNDFVKVYFYFKENVEKKKMDDEVKLQLIRRMFPPKAYGSKNTYAEAVEVLKQIYERVKKDLLKEFSSLKELDSTTNRIEAEAFRRVLNKTINSLRNNNFPDTIIQKQFFHTVVLEKVNTAIFKRFKDQYSNETDIDNLIPFIKEYFNLTN